MVNNCINLCDRESLVINLILKVLCNNVCRIFHDLSIGKFHIVDAAVEQGVFVVGPFSFQVFIHCASNDTNRMKLPILRHHQFGINQSVVSWLLIKCIALSIRRGFSEVRDCPWGPDISTMLGIVFIGHKGHKVTIIVLDLNNGIFGRWRSQGISPASFNACIKSISLLLLGFACNFIMGEGAMRSPWNDITLMIQDPLAHLVTLPIRWTQHTAKFHLIHWESSEVTIIYPLIPTILA